MAAQRRWLRRPQAQRSAAQRLPIERPLPPLWDTLFLPGAKPERGMGGVSEASGGGRGSGPPFARANKGAALRARYRVPKRAGGLGDGSGEAGGASPEDQHLAPSRPRSAGLLGGSLCLDNGPRWPNPHRLRAARLSSDHRHTQNGPEMALESRGLILVIKYTKRIKSLDRAHCTVL